MFERFLKDPNALARQRNGPLAEERRRYLARCIEERKSWETLRGTAAYILVIAETLRLAERPGELITRAEIDAAAEEWVNRPLKRDKERMLVFTGHAIRWLKFLGRLQVPPVVKGPMPSTWTSGLTIYIENAGCHPGPSSLVAGHSACSLRKSRKPASGSRS